MASTLGNTCNGEKGTKGERKEPNKKTKKNQARARAQCHGSNQEKTSNRIQCLDMQHVGVAWVVVVGHVWSGGQFA